MPRRGALHPLHARVRRSQLAHQPRLLVLAHMLQTLLLLVLFVSVHVDQHRNILLLLDVFCIDLHRTIDP